ncbi:MAG: OsmC family protein [bacterium]
MLEYEISARRIDEHGSIAECKSAELLIDTDKKGRDDAFNPAELLLAALAACILKNIERVAPMIHFEYRAVNIRVHGTRQDSPPKMLQIDYEIVMQSNESEHKLNLLHENIRKYGTVYNTIKTGTELNGTLTSRFIEQS